MVKDDVERGVGSCLPASAISQITTRGATQDRPFPTLTKTESNAIVLRSRVKCVFQGVPSPVGHASTDTTVAGAPLGSEWEPPLLDEP